MYMAVWRFLSVPTRSSAARNFSPIRLLGSQNDSGQDEEEVVFDTGSEPNFEDGACPKVPSLQLSTS